MFPQDDFKTLLTSGFLILTFSIYRFNPRIPIIYAILLLLIAGVLTSQKTSDDSVKKLAELSFWFLLVGITCIGVDLCRRTKTVEATA